MWARTSRYSLRYGFKFMITVYLIIINSWEKGSKEVGN